MTTANITTSENIFKNSVAEFIEVLKQADQASMVKDEQGRLLSVYLDIVDMSVVIDHYDNS